MYSRKLKETMLTFMSKKRTKIVSGIISTVCIGIMLLMTVGCTDKVKEISMTVIPKIVIGIDEFQPYSFNDIDGMPSGIDVDLAKEACSRMGYEPVFRYLIWDDKDKNLADGDIDCVWSCFSMNGREDKYLWVGPYMNSRQAVAVRQKSNISKISELKDKSIAVQSSTKPEQLFSEKSSNIPQVSEIYCFSHKDYVFAALRKNYVDAIAGHEYMLLQLLNEEKGEYRLLSESLLLSKLGVAFNKDNDSELPKQLKAVLNDMINDGTVAKIAEKYGLDAKNALGGITLE